MVKLLLVAALWVAQATVAQAVTFADIPVMAAYLCLVALIFVVINMAVDMLYFVVDPRLRAEKSTAGH